MEAIPLLEQTPKFALTIPRPWTWLIANGTRRDWLVATDPSGLVGRAVALHTAATGDAGGWRRLEGWMGAPTVRRDVAERCPHRAIVGVALVVGVDAFERTWRLRFGASAEVDPIGPISTGDLELWAIPGRQREMLGRLLVGLRRRAAASEGGAS